MKGLGKKLLSVLVTLMLAFNTLNISAVRVHATDGESEGTKLVLEEVDGSEYKDKVLIRKADDLGDDYDTLGSKMVRVSIVLDKAGTIDAGFGTQDIAKNKNAMKYRESLEQDQVSMAQKISDEVLGGTSLDVVWNITLAANIISANVPANKINEIKAMPGVKTVVMETLYAPAVVSKGDGPNAGVSAEMTTTTAAWAEGYTGAGSIVAIIDTGLDDDHQSYSAAGYDYAIEKVNAERAEAGLDPIEPLSKDDVLAVWDSLNASKFVDSANGSFYLGSKTPYAVNYIDKDYQINHDNDGQGGHGSHVAGIAAGNRYIPNGNDFEEALPYVGTQGEAPDAQLLIMKVFGKGGGAYDSDYMTAIEDAIVLGADSVNLSLGSAVAGFSYEDEELYQPILDNLSSTDTVVTISHGNSYAWADYTSFGYLYEESGVYHTGGSPGSYTNAFTVASVDNDGSTGGYITVGGQHIYYSETSGYGNAPMLSAAGTYDYIYVDNPGRTDNPPAGISLVEPIKDLIEGKVFACNRGSSSFFVKANIGGENGAIANVIVNNQPGTILMNLSGYEYNLPAVSITQADGELLKSSATTTETFTADDGNEYTYYIGSLEIGSVIDVVFNDSEYKKMSDFSSWGVPGNLSLKPEITAPGGSIYSVDGETAGGTAYTLMSGTSMAAPQIAGITAVVKQYIRDNDLMNTDMVKEAGLTERQLAISLLMSTATPLLEEDSGSMYSVMKQGAGLVNTSAAMNSKSFIVMSEDGLQLKAYEEAARDAKVKVELGDDPDRKGEYDAAFTLYNLTDKDIRYTLDGEFFTQDLFDDYGPLLKDTRTAPLNATLTWKVNGEEVEQGKDLDDYDFNADGVFNELDAQHLLDHAVLETEILANAGKADLDEDGDVDTYDAYLCLKLWNEAETLLPANGKIDVEVHIVLNDIDDYDACGAYVEGFLYAEESATEDGGLGVTHSIPVLGYYGSWDEPGMFDIGSYEAYYLSGDEDRPPYMYYQLQQQALQIQGILYQDEGDSTMYLVGGNPMQDEEYKPERNAVANTSTIIGPRFTQVRNASAQKLYVLADGEEVYNNESESTYYSAYYHVNDAVWKNTNFTRRINYKPADLEDGTTLTVGVQLAPEYYTVNGPADWDSLNEHTKFQMEFKIDTEAPELKDVLVKTDDEGKTTIEIHATDNQYIAGIALLDAMEGEVLDMSPSSSNEEPGADETFTFELPEGVEYPLVMVMDYAGLNKTYKVAGAEITEDPYVVVTPEEAAMILNTTQQFTASVMPWGVDPLDEVTWESSDETVATVDENGLVTAVGEGQAAIIATSVKFPDAYGYAVVSVTSVDKDLKGIVWDENGKVWFSEFNLSTLPQFTPLHSEPQTPRVAETAVMPDGRLLAYVLETWNEAGTLYEIDVDNDYAPKEIGAGSVSYTDIAPLPNAMDADGTDGLVATYAYYVVLADATGAMAGAFDYSEDLGSAWLVGATYYTSVYNRNYGSYVDYYLLLDDAGNVWLEGFIYLSGFADYGLEDGTYNFGAQLVFESGYEANPWYWQGFYCDGDALYWSQFVEDDNVVNMIMFDLNTDAIYNIGSFADGVWPVGGLYDDNAADLIVEGNDAEVPALIERYEHNEVQKAALDKEALKPIARETNVKKGATNAIRNITSNKSECEVTEEDENENATQGTVILEAEGEDLVHNGKYTVTWNPEEVELVGGEEGIQTDVKYNAYKIDLEKGEAVFGYIDEDGFEDGAEVARMSFKLIDEDTVSYIDVVTTEAEDQNPDTAEKYKLGGGKIVPAYTLTVTTDGNGSYSVYPNDEYYGDGEKVEIDITPNTDYVLDIVKVNGEEVEPEDENLVVVTIDGDTEVELTFKEKTYKITVSAGDGGTAEVDKTEAKKGEEVVLTVVPADGFEIALVRVNGKDVELDENGQYTFVVEGNTVIDVGFRMIGSFMIKVGETEHGTAEVDKTQAKKGEEVVLTLTPDLGYEVGKVLVNGEEVEVGEDGTVKIVVEGDTEITVTFEAVEYKFIEGMGQDWYKESGKDLTFKTDGDFELFQGLKVDGKHVDEADYEAKAGSTVITLKAAFLEKLAEGDHTLTADYKNGSSPETTFTVNAPLPPTGVEGANVLIYVVSGIVALAAAVLVIVLRKKNAEE